MGEKVVLRELRREDVEVAYAAQAGDYARWALTDYEPWVPESLADRLARFDKRVGEKDPASVWFTVTRRDDPASRSVGGVGLWDLKEHQRTAHVGIGLSPDAQGEGLGTEAVELVCDYAFRIRDLYRLQIETLAVNTAMRRAAEKAGFVQEGVLRQGAYVLGERVDDVVYGLLRPEWWASRGAGS